MFKTGELIRIKLEMKSYWMELLMLAPERNYFRILDFDKSIYVFEHLTSPQEVFFQPRLSPKDGDIGLELRYNATAIHDMYLEKLSLTDIAKFRIKNAV